MKNEIHLRNVLAPFLLMMVLRYFVSYIMRNTGVSDNILGLVVFLSGAVPAVLLFKYLAGKEQFAVQKSVLKFGTGCLYTVAITAALVFIMHLFTVLLPALTDEAELNIVHGLLAVFVYPFMEEYIFRKLFYGELRKMNVVFAVLMQAVMFALIHSTSGQMIYALFAGILLGVAAEKSRNITLPLVIHMLVNLRSFIYGAEIVKENLTSTVDIITVSAGVLAVAVLVVGRYVSGRKKAVK